jgi:hypothetical protein
MQPDLSEFGAAVRQGDPQALMSIDRLTGPTPAPPRGTGPSITAMRFYAFTATFKPTLPLA